MEKGSGILLHISALPSKYGIGGFSKEAKNFVKLLKYSGQKYWQVLPLNPTGFKDSPYQSCASFALNPYFIDLDELMKKGYITKSDIKQHCQKSKCHKIDYGFLYEHRLIILKKAAQGILENEYPLVKKFLNQHKYWLDDYALFMTLKELNNNSSWNTWEKRYKKHETSALDEVRLAYKKIYETYVAIQYIAFTQYKKLRRYAKANGVKIIGDMPIYVSYDSSDVWGHQKEFLLDKDGLPLVISGVAPDYFSKVGQLWGNPIYNYKKMVKNNFKWWRKRLLFASKLYDVIRIDHFRGFASYYEIQRDEKTAINGEWKVGPGRKIIDVFKKSSKAQIVAEDLGLLTSDVIDLLKYANYPGMKVFQFAFDGNPQNDFLPHRYEENCVAYLGTHDNETYVGFLKGNKEVESQIRTYFKISEEDDIVDKTIESLLSSKANVTIFLLQDILRLTNEARINTPGKEDDNWTYCFDKKDFLKEPMLKLYKMTCEQERY